MKYLKHKLPNPLLAGIVSLTMLTSTASAVDPVLTDTQLHAVLGVVTNFILDEETKNYKPPKKTGQVNSYNTNGNQVFVKDDGFYQTGVDHNYTRDDGNEIVTDHVTGLQWQDDLTAGTTQKPWLENIRYERCTEENDPFLKIVKCSVTVGDTAASYCTNLVLGGETDWRLPTRKELVSLSVYGQSSPAMDAIFQNVDISRYWSSTTVSGYLSNVWVVSTFNGNYGILTKDENYSVRCVRAGNEVTPPDFTKTGNIVTDNTTGLQWQDDAVGNEKSWQGALNHCEVLSLDGFNDWRLPNFKELISIVDDSTASPAIESTFQNTASENYWSSTTYADSHRRANIVDFYLGEQSNRVKSTGRYVRCVRAGQ